MGVGRSVLAVGLFSKPPKPSSARHASTPMIAHNGIYFCLFLPPLLAPCSPSISLCHTHSPVLPTLTVLFTSPTFQKPKTMAERNSRFSVKKKEKKVESKVNEDKEQNLKKLDKLGKNAEVPSNNGEKRSSEGPGATGTEAHTSEENGDFQPMELPPFEIITG